MAAETIERTEDGAIRLGGSLTFETVGGARAAVKDVLGPEGWPRGETKLDLGPVEHADSAGLALLVCWRREARAAEGTVRYAGVSSGLRAVARLCGVEGYLFS